MDNKTFAIAVNKFFYYVNNYEYRWVTFPTIHRGEVSEYLPDFFWAFPAESIEWLLGKWDAFLETFGRNGAMMNFYAELDGTNRALLLKWINENYELPDGYGMNTNEL